MIPTRLPSVVIKDFPHSFRMTIDGKVLHGVQGYEIERNRDGVRQLTVTLEVENMRLALGPDEDQIKA